MAFGLNYPSGWRCFFILSSQYAANPRLNMPKVKNHFEKKKETFAALKVLLYGTATIYFYVYEL